jgi:hypothetical protein
MLARAGETRDGFQMRIWKAEKRSRQGVAGRKSQAAGSKGTN